MTISLFATANPRLFYQGQPSTVLLNPATTMTTSLSGTGSSFATGTYYLAYTFQNSYYQETKPSTTQSVSITTAGQNIVVTTPAFPSGADSCNLYIGTTSTSLQLATNVTTAGTYTITGLPSGSAPLAPTVNSTAPVVMYTAPAATANVSTPHATAYVKEILITNTTSAAANVTLYAVPSGSSPSATNQLMTALNVAANDAKFLTGLNLMLSAGAKLQAAQGTNKAINVIISGIEIQ